MMIKNMLNGYNIITTGYNVATETAADGSTTGFFYAILIYLLCLFCYTVSVI